MLWQKVKNEKSLYCFLTSFSTTTAAADIATTVAAVATKCKEEK
jgi:hypothetical protein